METTLRSRALEPFPPSERKIELVQLLSLLKPITALNSKSQAEQPVRIETLLTL